MSNIEKIKSTSAYLWLLNENIGDIEAIVRQVKEMSTPQREKEKQDLHLSLSNGSSDSVHHDLSSYATLMGPIQVSERVIVEFRPGSIVYSKRDLYTTHISATLQIYLDGQHEFNVPFSESIDRYVDNVASRYNLLLERAQQALSVHIVSQTAISSILQSLSSGDTDKAERLIYIFLALVPYLNKKSKFFQEDFTHELIIALRSNLSIGGILISGCAEWLMLQQNKFPRHILSATTSFMVRSGEEAIYFQHTEDGFKRVTKTNPVAKQLELGRTLST